MPKNVKLGQDTLQGVKVVQLEDADHPGTYDDFVEGLPVPEEGDAGKVVTVTDDLSYDLETPEAGVQTLDDLTDVDIAEPTDGQILKYNATTQKWVNGDEVTVIDELSELEDVDLTSLADGQMIVYDATSQKWKNANIPQGYDDAAHTIDISNFNPSNPNAATLTFDIDKFIKSNKSIAVINITGNGIEEHISGDEVECKPSSDATVYIANDTPITYNGSLPANSSANFRFNGYITNQPASKVYGIACTQLSPTRYSYYYSQTAYDWMWQSNTGWKVTPDCRHMTISAGQSLSLAFATWLTANSNFARPALNKYELRFKFITNNKYYSCVIIVYENDGVWSIQSKTITEISTIPDAPTTDGEYNLKATVSSGTPTYSWNEEIIPDAPTADGTYALQVTVSSGTPTYSWVSTT